MYSLSQDSVRKISDLTGWTNISGYSNLSSYYAYGICNGELYNLRQDSNKNNIVTKISDLTGWTNVYGYSSSYNDSNPYHAYGICNGYLYSLSQDSDAYANGYNIVTKTSDLTGWTNISYSYHYNSNAYGICNGYLYKLNKSKKPSKIGIDVISLEDSVIVNSERKSTYELILYSTKAINSKLNLEATNSLIVNHEGEIESSVYSTIVNSKSTVKSGEYNVYWNNEGSVDPKLNAQWEYDENNLVNLQPSISDGSWESKNSLSRFTSLGYAASELGNQDLGKCPDPISDEEGFNNYVNSFGDWHPQVGSALIGKGVKIEEVQTDIEGTERPETPTLGAYEAKSN